MNRQQAIDILAKLKPELVKRFGVTRLALFGYPIFGYAARLLRLLYLYQDTVGHSHLHYRKIRFQVCISTIPIS